MEGKDKCNTLKAIRKDIAEKNGIAWKESECHHEGPCKGTCPKCEGELRRLERELELRKSIGKSVAVAGVSVAIMGTMTACTPVDVIDWVKDKLNPTVQVDGDMDIVGELEPLDGDVPMPLPETESACIDQLEGDVLINEDGTVEVQ